MVETFYSPVSGQPLVEVNGLYKDQLTGDVFSKERLMDLKKDKLDISQVNTDPKQSRVAPARGSTNFATNPKGDKKSFKNNV